MKTWGNGGISPLFLTLALDGGSGQLHAPAALPLMFKCVGTLITGKNEISEEIMMRIAAGS
jgi:hypothetical protein